MNDLAKNVILWVVIGIVLLSVFQNFGLNATAPTPVTYSDFLDRVRAGRVAEVMFEDQKLIVTPDGDGDPYVVTNPETDNTQLIGTLLDNNVEINAREPEGTSLPMQLFINAFSNAPMPENKDNSLIIYFSFF